MARKRIFSCTNGKNVLTLHPQIKICAAKVVQVCTYHDATLVCPTYWKWSVVLRSVSWNLVNFYVKTGRKCDGSRCIGVGCLYLYLFSQVTRTSTWRRGAFSSTLCFLYVCHLLKNGVSTLGLRVLGISRILLHNHDQRNEAALSWHYVCAYAFAWPYVYFIGWASCKYIVFFVFTRFLLPRSRRESTSLIYTLYVVGLPYCVGPWKPQERGNPHRV